MRSALFGARGSLGLSSCDSGMWPRALLVALACLPGLVCYGAIPAASAIAVDPSGNVWLTGRTTTASIPVTPDAIQSSFISSTCGTFKIPPGIYVPINCGDAFVLKLDPTGNVLYATYLGGQGDDGGLAIAVDRSGNVYITGYTGSSDFPITEGVLQSKNAGPPVQGSLFSGAISPGGDVFVTKLNPDGSLAYSTFLGGSGNDVPAAIQVDRDGVVYVAGRTESTDFPLTSTPVRSARGLGVVAKINPDGSALGYSTYFSA